MTISELQNQLSKLADEVGAECPIQVEVFKDGSIYVVDIERVSFDKWRKRARLTVNCDPTENKDGTISMHMTGIYDTQETLFGKKIF